MKVPTRGPRERFSNFMGKRKGRRLSLYELLQAEAVRSLERSALRDALVITLVLTLSETITGVIARNADYLGYVLFSPLPNIGIGLAASVLLRILGRRFKAAGTY